MLAATCEFSASDSRTLRMLQNPTASSTRRAENCSGTGRQLVVNTGIWHCDMMQPCVT